MHRFKRLSFLAVLVLSVAACSLPRGAALQSEILKQDQKEVPDFAVYQIDKNMVEVANRWPRTGNVRQYSWLPKHRGPIGRVILPGDVIKLSVWDSDDNSLLTTPAAKVANLDEVRVSPSGSVFVPYVGSVRVSGMTEQRAREAIQRELEAISPSAQVQLISEVGQRHQVSLVSGVNNPTTIPLEERDMTVLAAISQGGGISSGFEDPQVRLLRGNKTYQISMERLSRTPSLDTTLRSGDKVLVTETEKYFLALGAAGTEDLITFPGDHLTALDAISLMGGLSDQTANPEGILVLREYGAKAVRADGVTGPTQRRVVFTMDLTTADGLFSAGKFHIMPKDVVYVTDSPVSNARTVLSLIGSTFSVARGVTTN